ncbi:MFS transporter [Duganella sp. FT80W]|uniref:MFS transporter n=1 Tax=Duganella guangzhouensis TaxID=2666084 RepID=A0A6I2KYW0_9BURK|nr:MFS transporter [Duganella guangzhouensis]MRW91335.1 MFS transporter [Duganella guangzhouensis]
MRLSDLPAAAPAAQTAFGLRLATGLGGVLLAVLMAGLNENITKAALGDIRGAMGIGADDGVWLLAVYAAASVSAMAFAPWCSVTFSLRRFTIGAIAAFAVLGLLSPFAPNVPTLLLLRALQGLAGGALPPMLMTVALRFLPANIKLYGLASYALTATFGPNLATPLTALWTEAAGWQWAFWNIIPPSLLAMAVVAWGLPQDPLKLERLRQFDWLGLLLGLPAICMLVLGLSLGEHYNWMQSGLIAVLLVGGSLLLLAFMVNEWSHPLPFFKLQLLARRNLSHALLTLGGVLFVLLAASRIPGGFLAQVQGYRPLQSAPLFLLVALPQLLALVAVGALCNLRRVDCRWVLAAGLGLLALSAVLGTAITPEWHRDNFYLLLSLHIVAQPMAVIPLLMLATTGLPPQDGPFASAWFNTIKGFAAVLAGGVLDFAGTERARFHASAMADRLGNSPWLDATAPVLRQLHQRVTADTAADMYWITAALAAAMILLIPVLPTRVYPPRAA